MTSPHKENYTGATSATPHAPFFFCYITLTNETRLIKTKLVFISLRKDFIRKYPSVDTVGVNTS